MAVNEHRTSQGNATASLLSLITYIPVGNATASLLSLITYIPVGNAADGQKGRSSGTTSYIAKDEPQPQVAVALGLDTVNRAPNRSSL